MALVETVFSKQNHLLKQRLRYSRFDATFRGATNKKSLVFLHLTLFLLTHSPPQQVCFAKGVASQFLSDLHDLLLVNHDPIGLLKDRLKLLVSYINYLPTVLAINEFRDQTCIKRTGPV